VCRNDRRVTEPNLAATAGHRLSTSAIAILHLSGAHISAQDVCTISEDVLAYLKEQGVAV
jgi:hypothetical protein